VSVTLPPHEGEFLFWYVLAGTARLHLDGVEPSALAGGSAVAVPISVAYGLSEVSPDLEVLEVMLPA
jgi:mannose-6-phosphate isomerase-like protein (cupin superfamily)